MNTTSQTFTLSNNSIHHLLPIYPHTNDTNDLCLLLTNIPQHRLSEDQLDIRHLYAYHERTVIRPMNDVERRLAFLSRLWNINYNILDHNLKRLIRITNLFGANRIHRFSATAHQVCLKEDDYSFALEFFLQMDRHLFYMKTCTYRGAVRVSNEKSIFATYEPKIRYGIDHCNQMSCCLCYPLYKLTYRMDKPIVQFGPLKQHQFINKFRSILNCPATCTTRNIIYVLTCPCHQVDYIGETSSSLSHRLSYHQRHGNRIMQEFLLGQTNIHRIRSETKSNEILTKDSMALYRHSTQCSFAVQWFLDENPEYWPFVPTKNNPTKEESIENTGIVSTDTVDTMFNYANDVPPPPIGYHFTHQQKIEINQFFSEKKYLHSPTQYLDLFQADIITICKSIFDFQFDRILETSLSLVPNDASDALRLFVESLFITRTEAQLNTDGHLDRLLYPDFKSINPIQDQHFWCENLIHRSVHNT